MYMNFRLLLLLLFFPEMKILAFYIADEYIHSISGTIHNIKST